VPDQQLRALDILLGDGLEPIVEMVVRRVDAPDGACYEAAAVDGKVRFARPEPGRYVVEAVEGRNPLADQAVDRFAGIESERAALYPTRTGNAYPGAYEQVAQLFDAPNAPDLCVLHTAAHNWEDQGGHRGEHGSLGVVQARAPFLAAGAGVRREGMVDRAARLVDVAPTVLRLLGAPPLATGDGAALDVADPDADPPRTVVGFLLDGCNPNVLHDLAARGAAPNIARLMAMGTTYRFGAMAGLPTVTLANHTSIITGTYPGHHGILHNAWMDRATGQQVITNSPATWPWAMQWLTPGTDSIHHAIHRGRADAFTVSVDEPCDPGADYSTFDFFRRGDVPEIAASPDGLPHVTERFVRPSKNYAWSSIVDAMAREQACGIWSGEYRDEHYPRPDFMWVNFTLTDSAMHDGGPHSEMAAAAVADTDARIGDILDAIDAAGALDTTAFVLTADHGMEETNPDVTGDWDAALRDAGISFRDEGYGFIYLG
jgi:arylsulfatase A-like enzyme